MATQFKLKKNQIKSKMSIENDNLGQIDHYKLLKKLGQGEQAKVYLASDEQTG